MPVCSSRFVPAALVAALLLVFASGCGRGEKANDGFHPVAPGQPEVPEPAGHPEEGAHGGHLYDLGDHEYFAEIVFDERTRTLTIYTVDHDDINRPVPMDARNARLVLEIGEETRELPLTPRPQEGDPEGKSSRFELAGGQLPPEIRGEHDLHGDLYLSRDGQEYEVHLEPHEHHH